MRTEGAIKLINETIDKRKTLPKSEPISFIGHSHGGNVAIEAINKMVDMKTFEGIKINLITINTPVRDDYQLSKKARFLVKHINVYDIKDPIQSAGGKAIIINPHNPSNIKGTGEFGPAGRIYNNAINIEVNHPQNIFNDFHNSHNRINDWIYKY